MISLHYLVRMRLDYMGVEKGENYDHTAGGRPGILEPFIDTYFSRIAWHVAIASVEMIHRGLR